MKKIIFLVVCAAAAMMAVSCGKRNIPPNFPPMPLPPQPEIAPASDEPETLSVIDADEETEEITEEDAVPQRIIIPYNREYLSPGQETTIRVYLENGIYGDETYFDFVKEPGKNSIEVKWIYNVAVIKAIGEGEQYIRISHPKALESRIIVYDVLPPSPPPPPEIDVSESPLIIRKGETKPLQMILLNSAAADREMFQFKVIENSYAIEVRQYGSTLNVTGIAPGAGKIRIQNPAALRDYDVMVIVD